MWGRFLMKIKIVVNARVFERHDNPVKAWPVEQVEAALRERIASYWKEDYREYKLKRIGHGFITASYVHVDHSIVRALLDQKMITLYQYASIPYVALAGLTGHFAFTCVATIDSDYGGALAVMLSSRAQAWN